MGELSWIGESSESPVGEEIFAQGFRGGVEFWGEGRKGGGESGGGWVQVDFESCQVRLPPYYSKLLMLRRRLM